MWTQVGVNGSSSQDTEEEKTTEAPSTLVASLSDHGTISDKASSVNLFHMLSSFSTWPWCILYMNGFRSCNCCVVLSKF